MAVYYQRVSAGAVELAKVLAAAEVLALASTRLGLPHVEIRWVRKVPELEGLAAAMVDKLDRVLERGDPHRKHRPADIVVDEGRGFDGQVHPFGMALKEGLGGQEPWFYLVADIPIERIRVAVAHELKHLADWRDRLDTVQTVSTAAGRETCERRAEEFSRSWAGG